MSALPLPPRTPLVVDVAVVPSEARVDAAVLVVIDQVRASTTLTTLLDAGCSDVYVAGSVSAARRLARETGSLLAGEHGTRKPPGFDFDNSPSELQRAEIAGRRIVLSTTNGTAVLHRVRGARVVLIGCLRNATACGEAATRLALAAGATSTPVDDRGPAFEPAPGVQVVCAGSQGRFALEDVLAAGAVVGAVRAAVAAAGLECRLTDAAEASVRLRASEADPVTATWQSQGDRTLAWIGQEDDIPFCAEMDVSRSVPLVVQGPPMRVVRLGDGPAAGPESG